MNIWKKALILLGFGEASRQDQDNFVTNRVTLGDYTDGRSADALGLSAVWACVNLLAGTIASLPLMVYRTGQNGERTVFRDHPLYRVLHDSPNADQTALDFWEFICASVELHGNAYAEIIPGGLISLLPVMPDLVTVKRNSVGALTYEWTWEGTVHRVPQERMFHVRGFGGGALGGVSTLSACRVTFNSASAVEVAAANTFRNGIRPSGILSTDKPLSPEQRSLAEGLLQQKFSGAVNSGRPMLLDNGVKWEQLTINPEDAQMLESRRFSVEEICRIFGVPPHMIGHTENSTSWGTGLEQQTLGFQKFTLRRRLKRIEQAIEKQLLSPADRVAGVTIEFNLEGLLRADSKARSEFYQQMTNIGAMTINEVRGLENMPPVPGGDVPRMQMQNVPIVEESADGQDLIEGGMGAANVQEAALNGAQIQALQQIVQSVADGLLPAQSAIEMMLTAFPSLTPEDARRIIGPASAFTPAPKPGQ